MGGGVLELCFEVVFVDRETVQLCFDGRQDRQSLMVTREALTLATVLGTAGLDQWQRREAQPASHRRQNLSDVQDSQPLHAQPRPAHAARRRAILRLRVARSQRQTQQQLPKGSDA